MASFSSATAKNFRCRRAANIQRSTMQNGIFHFGFVPRFVGPRGHDRDAVVLGHLVISAVEIRLIAAGSSDTGARVIGNDQLRRAAEELESLHVAVDPVRQILAQGGSRKGVGAGAEHGDEHRCRCGLAGFAVMNRHGVAGPVDERLLARLVVLPEHDILIPVPSLIQLTEPAVAIAVRMSFAILLPEQLQRQMLVCLKLRVQLCEIDDRAAERETLLQRSWLGTAVHSAAGRHSSSGNGQTQAWRPPPLSRYR